MSEKLKLHSLPLFPLGSVLYPDGLLALRIFEVRYLDMIGKCHKNGAPFGVVALTAGAEVRRPEPTNTANKLTGDTFAQEEFCGVGTLATISEFSSPQAGLMVIRCVGAQRFKISARDKLKHGLWVADVERLDVDMAIAIPDDLKPCADALGKLIKSLQQRSIPNDQMPLLPPYQLDNCGWVANRWCELLPLPLQLKQRLMELDNPLVRLELVSDILERTGIAL